MCSLPNLWLFRLVCSLLIISANRVSPSAVDTVATEYPGNIITGIYGERDNENRITQFPYIAISNTTHEVWGWSANVTNNSVPYQSLRDCIKDASATEVKFAAGGDKIVAIIGYSAVVINRDDKSVQFAVCLSGDLSHAHTLELLPDDLLAIATTGQTPNDGVWIYDASKMVEHPTPIHQLPGIRAIHGLVWEQEHQMLWAAGNTNAVNGNETAYGIIQGYQYDNNTKCLCEAISFKMCSAMQLRTEWEGTVYAKWWDGPHDLVPVSKTRLLLIPMDRDIHIIDLSTGLFNNSGEQLALEYLKGFHPVGNRSGGNEEYLPRSDIKSISLRLSELGNWSVLYTQAVWREEDAIPKGVKFLSSSGNATDLYSGRKVYRSRWFADPWR